MAYQTPEQKWPWRDFLTEDELRQIRELEAKISEIDASAPKRRALAQDRYPIVNRAIQRAKYAAGAR